MDLSFHLDGFMVHRDVPQVTSSQQFVDDLATHLHITTGFTIPFDLKEHFSFTQLLLRMGEGVVLGPCATALGFTTGVMVSLHLGSLPGAIGDASLLDLVMF